MSRVKMSSKPAVVAIASAPATPPDGPETMVSTGREAAASLDMSPPSERTMLTAQSRPSARSREPKSASERETEGEMYVLTTAVMARSYSRYSGSTSCDSVTCMPGATSVAMARARNSCATLA